MNKWKYYLSSELLDIRDGTHDSPKYVNEGYPLITSKNLTEGKINFDNINFISKEDYISINRRSKVNVGDILYSMIGSIGNYALVKEHPVYAIKNVALFKFKDKRLLNTYFIHLLNSPIINRQIEVAQRGGTQKFVSLKILRNLKIPLPPLKTQQHIARLLDAADALRQKNKALLARYEELTQSLFLEMFGDPVVNPKGWDIVTVADLVSEVKYGTSSKAIENGKYPYLRMNNITYKGYMDYSNLKYIDIIESEKQKFLVKKGDVLFNRTNSKELVGKTGIIEKDEEMVIAGYLIRVRVNNLTNPYYLWGHLNSKWAKLTLYNMCKSIVGMANINAKELQKIKILKAPLPLQNQFAERVQVIEQQKALAQQALQRSEELFQCLLQQSFSG